MEVTFEDRGMRELAEGDRAMCKKLGEQMAKRLKTRLHQLRAAGTVSDLDFLPGRWHSLRENWDGHYSGDLKHPMRLIIRPSNPVHYRQQGGIDWTKVTSVVVVGIFDTHR